MSDCYRSMGLRRLGPASDIVERHTEILENTLKVGSKLAPTKGLVFIDVYRFFWKKLQKAASLGGARLRWLNLGLFLWDPGVSRGVSKRFQRGIVGE